MKLIPKNIINELAVRGKIEEFRIALKNRYSAFSEEPNISVEALNDNLTGMITECVIEVAGKNY